MSANEEVASRRNVPRAPLLAGALVACAALHCFNPPAEHRWGFYDDAGAPPAQTGSPDGGTAAPVDAGRECATFRDCPAQDGGALHFCPAPSPSCVAGRCVLECRGSRTCEIADAGLCLSCSEPGQTSCGDCISARRCTMRVDSAGCPGGFAEGSTFELNPSVTTCGHTLTPADGGAAWGSWVFLPGGDAVANIPELGGWCTVTGLFTGVPRMAVHCPACSFVEVGCE